MGYNQFIFSSLAARKSILIEGIGVVSVVRRGSSKDDRKSFREAPHYDLMVTHSALDYSLKGAVEGNYDEWLKSVTNSEGSGRKLDIEGCFILKINGDESVTIVAHDKLNILLNPFSAEPQRRRQNYRWIIFLALFILLCGGAFMAYMQYGVKFSTKTVATVVEVVPKVPIAAPDTLSASLIATDTIPEIILDSVEVVEPSEDKNGFTKAVKGSSYLVVGSFRELSLARCDAKRLEGYYDGMKVSTTMKPSGDYINYILTAPSYQEGIEAQKELMDKYDKISGIWVYFMR